MPSFTKRSYKKELLDGDKISFEDGKMIYGKTMQDTIVAFYTNKEKAQPAWKFFAGFGYEHTPSALIEKNGNLFFGPKMVLYMRFRCYRIHI